MDGGSLGEVWSRFGQLSDSVIRRFEVRTDSRPWSAVVEVDAQEPPNSNGPWHRIRFEFTGVREWRFEQTRSDMLVIFEARAERVDELICVSFDAAVIPENPNLDDFRRTDAFVAASAVEPSLRPLSA